MVELLYGIGKLKDEKIGEEHGRKEERSHVLDVLDDTNIAGKTGLSLEKVGKLRRNKNKIVDLFTTPL